MPIRNDIKFPEPPAVFDGDAPLISYEYIEDGETIRTDDLKLKGKTIIDVVVPYWLWKNLVIYIIDTEAAKERLNIKEGEEE